MRQPQTIRSLEDLRTALRSALRAKKWGYRQVDAAVGTKVGLSSFMRGDTESPKVGNLLRVLDALGLELRIGPKPRPPGDPETFVPPIFTGTSGD